MLTLTPSFDTTLSTAIDSIDSYQCNANPPAIHRFLCISHMTSHRAQPIICLDDL